MNRYVLIFILIPLLSPGPVRGANDEAEVGPADFWSESTFREGLRRRGLDDWLQQYLAETEPVDEIDAALREREKLLARARQEDINYINKQECLRQASRVLETLLEKYPEHPARLRWRYDLAADLLERRAPAAFDAVLLYEFTGRDNRTAHDLADQAHRQLLKLHGEIAAAWDKIARMDEAAIAAHQDSFSLAALEKLQSDAVALTLWARLYAAITEPEGSEARTQNLALLVQNLQDELDWQDLPATQPVARCNALLLTMLANHYLHNYERSNLLARKIVETLQTVEDPYLREMLRKAVLLGILEQLRVLRDTGKPDEALKGLGMSRQWAQERWPDSLQVQLTLALTERGILARKLRPDAPDLISNIIEPAAALAPLGRLLAELPTERDTIYSALSGTLALEPIPAQPTPLQAQLLAGGTLIDRLHRPDMDTQDSNQRLEKVLSALQSITARPVEEMSADQPGELLFLQGRIALMVGQALPAVQTLTALAEAHPDHPRTPVAVEQATAIAQEQLRDPQHQESPAYLTAFIRAGKLLARLAPEKAARRHLNYFLALALEKSGHGDEAIAEYARVPDDDPYKSKAVLGRVRCLAKALYAMPQTPAASTMQKQATQALDAAMAAARDLGAGSVLVADEDLCVVGEIYLLLANLHNHPAIGRPQSALDDLADFEKKFASCRELIAPALRERTQACKLLGRWIEARQVGERLLKLNPRLAAPILTDLLQAMHAAVIDADDQDRSDETRSIATQGATLAGVLHEACLQEPSLLESQDQAITRLWRAWFTLKSGHPGQALKLYETLSAIPLSRDELKTEYRLGRAEALLAMKDFEAALNLFTEVWEETPEHSEPWWRAFVGSLQCHLARHSDPREIVKSIAQQKYLVPELGAPRWKRQLSAIERQAEKSMAQSQPATTPSE